MINKIFAYLTYKFEEFKFSNKLKISIKKFELIDSKKIKIIYTYKQKTLLNEHFFYLNDLSIENFQFDMIDQINLYKILGVYEFLSNQNEKETLKIKPYIEEINNELQT